MSERKKYTLGELVTYKKGFAFKSSLFGNEGDLVVRVSDTTDNSIDITNCFRIKKEVASKYDDYRIKYNDIIIATVGSWPDNPKSIVGKVVRVPLEADNALLNQNTVRLRAINEIHQLYLYYRLKSQDFSDYLISGAQGSANQASITLNDIFGFSIVLPSSNKILAINETLNSIDAKAKLLDEQNSVLEQLAETLFRQWFIEEAEESWEEKSLDQIAEFLNGLACQKFPPKQNEIGLPVIKIKEMRTGITDASDYATSDVPEKYLVESGDMLFSWSGSLDIVLWFGEKGVLNQHLFKVSSEIYPQWFYYFWTQFHLQEFRGVAEDKATTMGHIQRHHLSDAKVTVPTKEELNVINKSINPLFQKIKSNTKQIQTLNKLRDTLLPKLMSGEVSIINDTEK